MKKYSFIVLCELGLVCTTVFITLLAIGYFEKKTPTPAPKVAQELTPPQTTPEQLPESNTSNTYQTENRQLQEKITELETALLTALARAEEAEGNLSATKTELSQLDDEFLLSYGSIEDLGTSLGNLAKQSIAIRQHFEALKAAGSDWKDMTQEERSEMRAKMQGVFGEMMKLGPVIEEIKTLPENPAEAARLQSAFMGEAFSLDSNSQSQIQNIYEQAYIDAQQQGLTASQKPETDIEQWEAQRQNYSDSIETNLSQILSHEQLEMVEWIGNGNYLNMPDVSMKNLKR